MAESEVSKDSSDPAESDLAPVKTELQAKERNAGDSEPDPQEDYLTDLLERDFRKQRAEELRRQFLPMPGVLPAPSEPPMTGDRFDFGNIVPAQPVRNDDGNWEAK